MRRTLLFFSICFLSSQMTASAQIMVDVKSNNNVPQWQITVDGIKSQAKILMDKNVRLMTERNDLIEQEQRLQLQIRDLQIRNDETKRVLKERHGKTDQQIQIEELTHQFNVQQVELARCQKELINLQKQIEGIDHVIALKKLKIAEIELFQKQEKMKLEEQKIIKEKSVLSVTDQELTQLQEKWEAQKAAEADLTKQLEDLKQAQSQPATAPVVDEAEIKNLRLRVQELALQKESLQSRNNVDNNQANDNRYKVLILKKKDLEEKIREYDNQLNQMKNPATYGLMSDRQKKQTLQQMVEIDNRNAQLRQRIADLKDDVKLLREQVAKLERKATATKAISNTKK